MSDNTVVLNPATVSAPGDTIATDDIDSGPIPSKHRDAQKSPLDNMIWRVVIESVETWED